MLILTRCIQQEILIGNDVRIQVMKVQGNRVRLGITAPEHVPVLRAEMLLPKEVDLVLTETTGREPSRASGANGGCGDPLAEVQAHSPNSPVLADVPLAHQELVVPDAA